ncbi:MULTISPECIES: hypothetical protein [Shewanella]|uniref:hypothetical protein n=1 Tax=Shewanella TaxID=22 RepID=UPI001C65CD18|nr:MULTISPECIES: hypothetical protein [Shewanella]QYJ75196.1 hypothetical protein K0H79_17945 [Shewanella sp. FJAT-52076]QYK05068.1 hypothetical protein K0H63_18815 [Shewanella zhangzhouensis]
MKNQEHAQDEDSLSMESLEAALLGEDDWLHVQETVKLLLLSMAQIELTLTDGEYNVTGLGQQFTDMASHLRQVNLYLANQPDTPKDIIKHGIMLETEIDKGVVAFQFYDRLSQRLQHVVTGLALTEDLLCDDKKRLQGEEWLRVQKQIKSTYSLECERKMFDLVLQGMPLHEALALYRDEHLYRKDDIELF